MFHTAAYQMLLGVGTDIDVPAQTDQILTITNNHFILGSPMDLVAFQAFSALLDRVKLSSPTMRQIAAPYMQPIEDKTIASSNPNLVLMDATPFRIPAFEEIQCLATSTIAAATEQFTALLWLQDMHTPIPPGGWIPLRWTSTGTAVVNSWTSIPITFADTIPSGVYAAVMSECFSTNAIAHRWTFSGQFPRPGYPSQVDAFSRHPYAISKGQWGMMGTFRSNDLPRLEVMANVADAVHKGYLSVVKIASL